MSKDKPIIVTAPATIIATPPPPESLPKVGDKNTAPTTTAAEDLLTQGQRHINRVWEYTQAGVALLVTSATLFVAGKLALSEQPDTAAFLLLSNVFFMVMGMYFQRTNHQKQAGVQKGDIGR